MQEKPQWEIVDEPIPAAGAQSGPHAQFDAQQPQNLQQLLKAFLGRWWRWKILGAVTFTAVSMVLLAMLTGVVALFMAFAAVMAIGIGKIRQWARRRESAVSL